jgi:hypothetical protein
MNNHIDYNKVISDYYRIHKESINKKDCNVRYCNKCNKKMRNIKNDFNGREFCKKCYFENEQDRRFKNFLI